MSRWRKKQEKLPPKAEKKYPKREVRLEKYFNEPMPAPVPDGAWAQPVVQAALDYVLHNVRQSVRDQYVGQTQIKDWTVLVELKHKKSGTKLSATSMIERAETLSQAELQHSGKKMGETLARELAMHQMDVPDVRYKSPVTDRRITGSFVDPKPDMSEAMAVAELLDKTRCAACGYTEIEFPDWDDECNHTPEERAGC